MASSSTSTRRILRLGIMCIVVSWCRKSSVPYGGIRGSLAIPHTGGRKVIHGPREVQSACAA